MNKKLMEMNTKCSIQNIRITANFSNTKSLVPDNAKSNLQKSRRISWKAAWTLLPIKITGLLVNVSKNVWITGTTPNNVNSGKTSARCTENRNQRYQSGHTLTSQRFLRPLSNVDNLIVICIQICRAHVSLISIFCLTF